MTFYDIVAEPGTPQWHEKRATGFGGSEAAAAAGVSDWSTPLELFGRKTGRLPGPPETDAMRMGRKLEPVIASEFLERHEGYSTLIAPCGMIAHPEYPFVFATPDAILRNPEQQDEVGEWKSTSGRLSDRFGAEGSDEVPVDYLCQVQQELACTGLSVGHVAVLLDGRTLRTYRIERSEELIAAIVEAERELWERIQNDDPPAPNWEHSSTPRLISQLQGAVGTEVIELGADLTAIWLAYETMGKEISAMEKAREVLKAKVIHALGDNMGGILDGEARMVRRKEMPPSDVSYTRDAYIDVRAVKTPKGK